MRLVVNEVDTEWIDKTVTTLALATPQSLTGAWSGDQVRLGWSAVSGADQYEVKPSESGIVVEKVGTASSHAFGDLDPTVEHVLYVRATDDQGGVSAWASVRVEPDPNRLQVEAVRAWTDCEVGSLATPEFTVSGGTPPYRWDNLLFPGYETEPGRFTGSSIARRRRTSRQNTL